MKFLALSIACLYLATSWAVAGFIINPYRYVVTGGGGDPYFSSVVLLLNCQGTNGSTTFTDDSNSAHTVTAVGSAQISTTDSKFGGGCLLLDGTGDRLSIPDSANWDLSGGDYTIELWVRFTSVTNASLMTQSTGSGEWNIFAESGQLYYQRRGGTQNTNGTWTRSTNTWYYVAIVRSGSTTTLYIDGTSIASSSNNPAQSLSNPLLIGGLSDSGGYDVNGRMGPIRITKGVARDCTVVPTAIFPTS